jgi:hypothetical protein
MILLPDKILKVLPPTRLDEFHHQRFQAGCRDLELTDSMLNRRLPIKIGCCLAPHSHGSRSRSRGPSGICWCKSQADGSHVLESSTAPSSRHRKTASTRSSFGFAYISEFGRELRSVTFCISIRSVTATSPPGRAAYKMTGPRHRAGLQLA